MTEDERRKLMNRIDKWLLEIPTTAYWVDEQRNVNVTGADLHNYVLFRKQELIGQRSWWEALGEMLERREYADVKDSIANAIKLLERQAAEGER